MEAITRQVMSFWFRHHYLSYFKQSEQYDEAIIKAFSYLFTDCDKLHLYPWHTTKQSFLCYILILDQFPRHIYRYTAQAYAYDQRAIRFCKRHKRRFMRYIQEYTPTELLFVLLPFQHSENIRDQAVGIVLIEKLISVRPHDKILHEIKHHQLGHYRVIKKFGRFPKRNMFMHRPSTATEQAYLRTSDPSVPY